MNETTPCELVVIERQEATVPSAMVTLGFTLTSLSIMAPDKSFALSPMVTPLQIKQLTIWTPSPIVQLSQIIQFSIWQLVPILHALPTTVVLMTVLAPNFVNSPTTQLSLIMVLKWRLTSTPMYLLNGVTFNPPLTKTGKSAVKGWQRRASTSFVIYA